MSGGATTKASSTGCSPAKARGPSSTRASTPSVPLVSAAGSSRGRVVLASRSRRCRPRGTARATSCGCSRQASRCSAPQSTRPTPSLVTRASAGDSSSQGCGGRCRPRTSLRGASSPSSRPHRWPTQRRASRARASASTTHHPSRVAARTRTIRFRAPSDPATCRRARGSRARCGCGPTSSSCGGSCMHCGTPWRLRACSTGRSCCRTLTACATARSSSTTSRFVSSLARRPTSSSLSSARRCSCSTFTSCCSCTTRPRTA
mmetsp:Transcript_7295/g.21712  ORF Transcript_7295/g.21712 Transcript_7295/m.21712 type:complete len:261 (+) Transcript_7295:906-1688(+)